MVDSLVQTTAAVSPRDGWSYWKDTVLAAMDCQNLDDGAPFGARRSVTSVAGGIILDTASSPLSVHRSARGLARDYIDFVALTVFVEGHGLGDPRDSGGTALSTGEIALCDLARPHRATGLTRYRELRLYMPRAAFSARIGPIDDLLDLRIPAAAPLAALFTRYFRGLCDLLPTLSRQDADAGVDGVAHLLSALVAPRTGIRHDGGEQASGGAMLKLAESHIAAMLGDPAFDGAALMRAIGVSRSNLYRVFAGRGGVAAAIRDARLDRARQRLASPADRHLTLVQIAYRCGFEDYSTFVRAFRRRFDTTPRDCRRS